MSGDYQEIIGVQLDNNEWRSSLDQAAKEYDDFISRLNSKGDQTLGVSFDDAPIMQQLANIGAEIAGLADVFREAFGAGADAAADSADAAKASIAGVTDAAVTSEKTQTQAVVTESEKRTAARTREAREAAALQKELKSAGSSRDAQRFDAASLSARQSLERELQNLADARERSAAQEEEDRAKRQKALKNAPIQLSDDERFDSASSSAEQSLQAELDRLAKRNAEAASNSGESEGGFLAGIGDGILGLTKFYAELELIMVAFRALGAIAKAPFEAIGDGIRVISAWEEKSSELKSNLLDSGIFSKDPAKNLEMAGTAADALYQRLLQVSTQLNIDPDRLQAAFAMFNDRGGSNLTHNLSESADVAGYVTAALQSQNPQIQQRQIASQVQKLVSATLKDSDKLPAAFGLSAEALNRMATEARTSHDLLQQMQAAAPGLADRFADSDNRLSSLVEKLNLMKEQLEGTVAAPLFAVLVSAAKQLADWIERNQGNIQGLLSELGGMVGGIASQFVELGRTIGSSLGGPLEHAIKLLGAALTMVQQLTAGYDIALNVPGALRGDKAAQGAIHGDVDSIRDSQEQQRRLNERFDDTPQQARDAQLKRAQERAQSEFPDDKFARDQFLTQQRNQIEDAYQQRVDPKGYLDSKVNAAIGSYTPKPIPPTAESIQSQVSKLRELYERTVKDITSAGTEFRKQVDADVKAGIATLQDATSEKATSFDSQAREIEEAGRKYTAALRGVHGTGDGNFRASLADTIRANNRQAFNEAADGERADIEVLRKLNQELEQAKQKSQAALAADASHQALSSAEERERRGVINPEQFNKEKSAAQDSSDRAELESLRQQLAAIQGNDPDSVKRRAELQGQIDLRQQQQSFHRADYSRSSAEDSFSVQQRQESMRVAADQARVQQMEAKQRQHEVEGDQPDDIRSDKNDVLNARLTANSDQIKELSDALDHLTEAIKSAPENAANPAAAIAANPKVQQMRLQIANLAVDNATIRDLKTQNMSRAGFGNQTADKLLGKVDSDTGAHFDSWQHSAESLQNLSGNISNGVNNVFSAYQQEGAWGAAGAGLQTLGSFIPGPAGSIIGAIGSLTSMFTGLFTQAAQEIGKSVARAVDEVMEKYSTGQLSLNDTIQQVQQQINQLISSESGIKGGQGVLDKELPGLQQELDSLKYQQQQEQWNFQDAMVEGSSTNSVVESWLTDWININKQVYQYHQAVGDAGNAQIAQYLNEQMQQQQVNLQNQYNQGQQQAINDALQLNQLLQQRNNYEDQYRMQQFQIISADSLQRRGNPAEESARKMSLAKSQYDIETQQMNYEIAQTQQKVDLEKQIFNLASDTATLQEQSLTAQNYQLQQQMAQYKAIVQLLAETSGANYSNGKWNIPGVGTSSGGGFTIPGTTNNDNSVDNSGQSIQVVLSVPPGMSTSDLANEIANELAYVSRTRS